MTTLLLDSDIRDWVVLPLFVIMIAAGLLRQNVGVLLKADPQKSNFIQQRAQGTARHASKLKSGASHYISTWQWQIRRMHYAKLLQDTAEWCESDEAEAAGKPKKMVKKEDGTLVEADDSGAADDDPMSNMMNPLSMMKGNMAFMVQNMVMMQGIQHFFSGFILLKVPFPLTFGFKQMFQRGLFELPTLDTSYVSSVSWYFLVMFGLRSFFKLAIGDPSQEQKEQQIVMTQLGFSPANPAATGSGGDANAKMLRGEAENIEMFLQTTHKSKLDGVEKRLLGSRYPKKAVAYGSAASAANDFLLGAAGVSRGGGKKKKAQ
ncbi:membrane protein complex subunit 3 [Seminavis robusta]|uniref:ER membrane protein complex subunit 3 n=1 Tax=Seminavis robusta TaxID=568900 RepID=A0A9N8H9X5_9STRA|nr:membrane protein complex subunit 3 [Seminavis robusta]|eukprot:Sro271_g104500.1 membrane protein complex subunit 3 (319) ;mRNA; f:25747-26703